jgi:lipopolysaccharide assembly outer membrane protein LptD (OstA)
MVFNIAFFKNGGMNHWILIAFVWLTSILSPIYGQKSPSSTEDKRVKVLFAKDFLISQEGENSIQKLVGEVELKQKNIRMYCDSAIIQNETLVWAYGNVVFWEGDSIKVFSNAMEFNSDSSIAKLIGNIQLNKNKSKLFTDTLLYDLNRKLATYKDGGIFYSGDTQLSSKQGSYNTESYFAAFKDSVVVIDSDFALRADTLTFDTDKEIIYFNAPTRLKTDSAEIYTESGFYETISGKADFIQKAQYKKGGETATADTIRLLEDQKKYLLLGQANLSDSLHEATGDIIIFSEISDQLDIYGTAHYIDYEKDQNIKADSIRYNKKEGTYTTRGRSLIIDPPQFLEADQVDYQESTGFGLAFGNIVWRDTSENITLYCDSLLYQKSKEYFKAFNKVNERPLMVVLLDNDSLFLSANTLSSIRPDTTGMDSTRIFIANQEVRVFKSDLQAVCDSLSYNPTDSLISMFKNPVAWTDTSQFSADTLILTNGKQGIKEINLTGNSIIINELDSIFYNQIQGRTIDAFFVDKNLDLMSAKGNAEVVYYIKDEDDAYVGVDKTSCGMMNIIFGDNEVDKIVFYVKPKTQVLPMLKADHLKIRLSGFSWNVEAKPKFPLDVLNVRQLIRATNPQPDAEFQNIRINEN